MAATTALFPTPLLSAPSINMSSPSSSNSNSTPRNPTQLSSSMVNPQNGSSLSSSHTSSSSATAHSSVSTVVPQYPYNVSMPPFAGALLPYERAPMPDDNDVQTRLPSICVDYLSHNWDESDVWTSWKAMTRHKHEMANGVRLENASWRTWAKQRSNLKTISPETLNWLKDSDVTWLYGPLHTAVDPVPPPKMSSLQDRFNLDSQAPSPDSLPGSTFTSRPGSSASVRSMKVPGKPILKHRSLSEILGVTNHPASTGGESGSEAASDREEGQDDSEMGQTKRPRVSIAHPASDSTLVNMGLHDPASRGSPPVLGVGYESSTSGEDSDANHSVLGQEQPINQPVKRKTAFRTSGNTSSGGSGAEDHVKPKKHISFSHRVEQCIAVDSEEERGLYATKSALRSKASMRVSSSAIEEDDDDDDEEEDDVLTFRSSASRHPGISVPTNRYGSYSSHLPQSLDQQIMQSSSSSSMTSPASTLNEPHTIARMAPTTLKSSEVLPAPSPVVVYDRDPIWTGTSNISHTPSGAGYPVYTVTASPSGSDSLHCPPTAAPLPTPPSSSASGSSIPSYYSRTYGPVVSAGGTTFPIASPIRDENPTSSAHYTSAAPTSKWASTGTDDDDTEEFTAMGFDYFSGPDLGLGDEYDMSRLPSQHLAGSSANGFIAGGINEDPLLARSVAKSVVSPLGSTRAQGPVLVPQLKSPATLKPSPASSSSASSSLTSSPLSHPNGPTSSISSVPTPSHSDKFSQQTLPQPAPSPGPVSERPDRLARGRSSSRGSSASSFERASTDPYRRSSHSPSSSQSPPAGTSAVRLGRSSGSSSSLSRGSGGKCRLIDVTIGEEAEEDERPSGRTSSETLEERPGSKLISAPRPASTQLFDEDLDLKQLLMKKSGSMVSLEWADEPEQPAPKRLSNDEFGFGNYYNPSSTNSSGPGPEEEPSGVIGKAVETAKELVGAIWSVGTRSIWGVAGGGGQNGDG
ncbi:hypothetical protein CROQUDRAFT_670098 [Cronartium quercuum f. sp. fusiforme G11]|uniref:Nitrogen regulatory protein areA GATA-like domain-containing protein n=1 Tax=Cronartium quercuum f. sp. fusiforme G11 TaxID=708437 RepID=A0A9P6TDT9_9BASI|nr:hypothetical protein CROQUDRAFT_670098 [Cronartium quercuum f. sp. fusiforme G11]